MVDYQGKNVVIIGLGVTGLSCVRFFLDRGVVPRVMDTRSVPPGVDQLPENITCHSGGLNEAWLKAADLIVASPGIALATPQLQQAAQRGIEIVGDIELFCREVSVPVVAITGSNGKSTVTSLVGEMAKAAGISVGVGGNIGTPVLSLLNMGHELYVLELSSFQLETTSSLKAAAATVLNISEDHMDRYPLGLEQYRDAKLKIYHNAQNCIFNAQDPLTLPADHTLSGCMSFGLNSGDYYFDTQKRALVVKGQELLAANEMYLTGQHNYLNALAALALAEAVNIPQQACINVLKEYAGLAHRFELVLLNKGVRWVNDSKATNVGSTEAALNGLHVDGDIYLLLGGDGKSADFTPLKQYVNASNYHLYCFGRDGEVLASIAPEKSVLNETMEQSLRQIAPQLKPGDMVLLSPACASLDQFKNFEQRGAVFAQLAKELG